MADKPLGRFCWFDLMTPAPEDAIAFYGKVTGWGTAPFEGGNEPYTMWMNGEMPVGGMIELPAEASTAGVPPHWLAYVSTPDLEATAKQAVELGATRRAEMDIPTVGSVVMITDPQGANIALFEPLETAPGHDGPAAVGEFSWHELATDGWEDAWDFYSQLFGWEKTDAMDMGDMGMYQMFGRGAHPLGGMFDRPKEIPVPSWTYYVRVPDIEAAVAAVREAGGQILNGPMEVPGGDMIAQCMDPQGSAFAVHATAG